MGNSIESEFFAIVAQWLDLDLISVRRELSFIDDLGVDEISVTELFFMACERFYVEKPSWLTSTLIEWSSTPEGAAIQTVGDMLKYIQDNQNTETY